MPRNFRLVNPLNSASRFVISGALEIIRKSPDFTRNGSHHFIALLAGKRFGELRQIRKRSVDAVTRVRVLIG